MWPKRGPCKNDHASGPGDPRLAWRCFQAGAGTEEAHVSRAATIHWRSQPRSGVGASSRRHSSSIVRALALPPLGFSSAGYNRWAESKHIVVLHTQAVSIPDRNPNGCRDWWGYTDANFANRKGVQNAAIRAMVEQIA